MQMLFCSQAFSKYLWKNFIPVLFQSDIGDMKIKFILTAIYHAHTL